MKKEFKRIVIKIGTSLLASPAGELTLINLSNIVRETAYYSSHEKKEIIIVSSGAIGAGMSQLGLKERPKTIPAKQACAAVGQSHLVQMYEQLFRRYRQTIAQILLTHQDLSNRNSYINIYNTLLTLLRYGVIPIINENDSVATDEIKFGDNDVLSALVAHLIEADLLIILTNVDGLYRGDHNDHLKRELISEVSEISEEIYESAKGACYEVTTGGMAAKVKAAKITVSSGIPTIIANGKEAKTIDYILRGKKIGTIFLPKEDKLSARKRWILFNLVSRGELVIDEGAKKAILERGKSLLPSGIIEVKGKFELGEAVALIDEQGGELAKGLVNYSQGELSKIKGKQSGEIEEVLGYKSSDEVIHRDNLALI